jgi:poly(hydroxyalkanoate) depolymerase family esterase
MDTRPPAATGASLGESPPGELPEIGRQVPPRRTHDGAGTVDRAGPGEFTHGTHTHLSQTRRYKLYSPPGNDGRPLPLVVMLHGCTQEPDDFATGTGMNEQAREQAFFVLYPEQSQYANPSRCWNWFKHDHQQRDSGEPALLASMTQAVIRQHDIDAHRVYIAGLSAGGAMAAIVAAAYPEIFAAAGVHSGLPRGAASNVLEALTVMKNGNAGPGPHSGASRTGTANAMAGRPQMPVPTIVFHGDQDRTVHPRNGEQVIAAALGSSRSATVESKPQVERGASAQGRRYTRSTHRDDRGHALAEHWLLHGAGHAWSGGNAEGSYTDAAGPDATREMLRFFFERPHGPAPQA